MDKIDLHQGMTLPQVIYTEWKRYQDQIKEAIAPLTADQLRLRAAPTLRPLGENIAHIIATRVGWFNNYLEENDSQIAPLRSWDDPDLPQPERSAAELVAGMDESWQFM
ncbi:MAG TPA: DinB family protein, partial [Anaerolineales bacterium]|nr:DinB family protein [Anaerolineales bacterium]